MTRMPTQPMRFCAAFIRTKDNMIKPYPNVSGPSNSLPATFIPIFRTPILRSNQESRRKVSDSSRRPNASIPFIKAYIVRVPHQPWPHVWLTVAYSELGREQEARAQIAEILRISPHFSLKAEKERLALQDQALEERFADDLRKA